MNSLINRATDIGLIVLGAFIPALIGATGGARGSLFDGALVAFAAALALSVFPACGIYEPARTRSMLRVLGRTVLAWIVVQGMSTALLYVLHRAHVLSSEWFVYWTLASGLGLIAFRALTLAIFGMVERAGDQVRAAAIARRPAAPIKRVIRQTVKRSFDLVGASLLLVLLAPVLLGIAWAVRRDGGPAIFGHGRVGRNGRPFKCLKFRSMVTNADAVLKALLERDPDARAEWDREFKLKNDVRITPVGRFLRKTSLDELPQLMNVLKGDMSLVGPRPIVEAELERYGADVRYYLMAKPGMTGLWQVSGRNDIDYSTRVSLDVSYVREWSLRRDIGILFRTINVVLRGSGAY
ncbi:MULTISPECIES: sugar transferase [Burkholderia]|jgi:lipopolysaccharide/colanic/teichoic acid biosynthesis glycosyltransferase|uniref:Sugar transferase n=2 Tax=Burkholderia contaminans TaxID=488447 RepID=A0A1E3FY21_9BURK|nr:MULTISPECIES: sugar transferase [Burkholderia]UTP27449.1 sugar transferase [Burkholderia sp. FXe9]KKL42086.1 UDP-phosphate galactose phosphotransferase [Burkholderia contaminans LMG 23361]MBA9829945.1 UDP-phosphate galactose phosphotransferase [Burkholderia contaminans]MBA9837055.1 UDP-phosphate galactose phosphotransferase [Burkholderia contaminans]MBA9861685.1 UDP-phosphate galactose phosphotransferase [Burkholderia contaminans]